MSGRRQAELADTIHFKRYPHVNEYTRPIIAGEALMPFPPSTKVTVRLDRATGVRTRCFDVKGAR
jgi:hypothetical protein